STSSRCIFSSIQPRRPPNSTPFPYTTLFRSHARRVASARPAPCLFLGRFGHRLAAALVRIAAAQHRRGLGGVRPGPFRIRHSPRSEEHTSELQSRSDLVCRLLLEKKKRAEPR